MNFILNVLVMETGLTCTAHLPLNAGWMPRYCKHILFETTMCLLRQSGTLQREATLLWL